jgi:hypothetical protein
LNDFQDERTMAVKETLVAFACGVAAMVMAHTLFVDLDAQVSTDDVIDVCVNDDGVMRVVDVDASCSPGERRVRLKQPEVERSCDQERQADVAALRNRIAALEAHTDEGAMEKATAPFEVVNEAGVVVFSVVEPNGDLPGLTRIFNETGGRIATIAARTTGGEVSVSSPGPPVGASPGSGSGVNATLAAWGDYSDLTVTTNSNTRLQLGRRRQSGNYGLSTFNAGGTLAAGLGSTKDGAGIALIFDALGKTRIALESEASGPGLVRVFDAAGKPVAALTGNGAAGSGLLQLTNSAGVPMVNAEVFPSGVGAVRAGPSAFQHGVMFTGLPASYIEGRK